MATGYTIPGYFVNCEIKNNEVKERGIFGKTLYIYRNNKLLLPGITKRAVLEFKNGGIYEYKIAGRLLFYVTKTGEVKEKGLFGRTVGRIPAYWVSGYGVKTEEKPKIKKENTNSSDLKGKYLSKNDNTKYISLHLYEGEYITLDEYMERCAAKRDKLKNDKH